MPIALFANADFACGRVTFFAPAKKVTKESRPRSAVSGHCVPTDPLRASHPAARAETRPAASDTRSLVSAECSSAQLLQGGIRELRTLNCIDSKKLRPECGFLAPLEAPRSAEQHRKERALFDKSEGFGRRSLRRRPAGVSQFLANQSRSGDSREGRVAQRPVLIEHRRVPATSGRWNGGALLWVTFLGHARKVTRRQAKPLIENTFTLKHRAPCAGAEWYSQ